MARDVSVGTAAKAPGCVAVPAGELAPPGGGDRAGVLGQVLADLTELLHLAGVAVDCWHDGNEQGALDALTAIAPVTGAAAAQLNVLLELRAAERTRLAAEDNAKRVSADPSDWLG